MVQGVNIQNNSLEAFNRQQEANRKAAYRVGGLTAGLTALYSGLDYFSHRSNNIEKGLKPTSGLLKMIGKASILSLAVMTAGIGIRAAIEAKFNKNRKTADNYRKTKADLSIMVAAGTLISGVGKYFYDKNIVKNLQGGTKFGKAMHYGSKGFLYGFAATGVAHLSKMLYNGFLKNPPSDAQESQKA